MASRLVPSGSSLRVLAFSEAAVSDRYVEIAAFSTVLPGESERHLALSRHRFRRLLAPWRRWDLVIVGDHVIDVFPGDVTVVHVPHGLVRSRALREGSYMYDRRRFMDRRGRPRYARTLDASESGADFGRAMVPDAGDFIAAVGDIRTDLLAELSAVRSEFRQVFDISEAVPTLVVMSTWGPYSLIAQHGAWLFDELAALLRNKRLQVVMTYHPNWGSEPEVAEQLRTLERHGARIFGAGVDWELTLSLADLALADHTSLSAPFLLTGRPVIFVSVPAGVVGEDTLIARAMEVLPVIDGPGQLMLAVTGLLATEPPETEELRREALSHRGESRARVSLEIARVLCSAVRVRSGDRSAEAPVTSV